jgi:heat shock protein HslJ
MSRVTAVPTGVMILLLALGLAACGSDNTSNSASPATSPGASGTGGIGPTPLEGTAWVLGTDALGLQGVDQFTPTALFKGGTLSGNGGCNGYSGSYTVSGSSLMIGNVLHTQMSCGPIADAIETAYLGRLGKVTSFIINGTTLTLSDASGTTQLTFTVSTATLVGHWNINGYLQTSGQAFSSVVNGSNPTAVFGSDGTLSGNTGCNTFTGTYKTEGDTITVSPLATTRKACPPDLSDQEAGILAGFQTATRFEVSKGSATLLNGANQRAIEFLAP